MLAVKHTASSSWLELSPLERQRQLVLFQDTRRPQDWKDYRRELHVS